MAMYYYARKLQRSAASSSSLPKFNKSSTCKQRTSNGPLPCCSFPPPASYKYDPVESQPILGSTLPPPPPSINHSQCRDQHLLLDTQANAKGIRPFPTDNLDIGVFKGSQLMRGSVEDVMEVLVPTESHFPDPDVLFAFLLSIRLTTPPHQLLKKIFRRFGSNTSPSPPTVSEIEIEDCNLDEDRVHLLAKFVRLWTELLPHDFRDDRMMHFVRIIARICININLEVREDVSQLLANLLSKLTALEVYEGNLGRIKTEASIGEPIAAPSVVTICPNAERMAEQLTLVELERFSHIGAQEFVAQLLRKDRRRASGSEENSETTNLDAFITWFKRLTAFVASEICKGRYVSAYCCMIIRGSL